MKITYNSNPEYKSLYNESLDIEVLEGRTLSIIPANSYVEFTIDKLTIGRELGEYFSSSNGIKKTDRLKRFLRGVVRPINDRQSNDTIHILGQEGTVTSINLCVYETGNEPAGFEFDWFEADEYSDERLYLSLFVSKTQYEEIERFVDAGFPLSGKISIDTKDVPYIYQEWHPGVYGYFNRFDYYLLPSVNLVENASEMPEHFGAISPKRQKNVKLQIDRTRDFVIPQTADEIIDEEDRLAAIASDPHSRSYFKTFSQLIYSLLSWVIFLFLIYLGASWMKEARFIDRFLVLFS
ncbi:hypothetical protein [Candidatus Puniceispirillum marinum]|uniref:Uncharacterized protein n=1 Tax=Puniceispirillum marinum (strain IMCC1322) TaxID=488538 RepID=D5BPE4_PUNMI|nr:hypothetical protein [Candidatus Puniceispirillum marinum]ADE38426.1 hypothetical protein SAR116_0183 [Candidatus Puniceispirillum marinum IMCC1322]